MHRMHEVGGLDRFSSISQLSHGGPIDIFMYIRALMSYVPRQLAASQNSVRAGHICIYIYIYIFIYIYIYMYIHTYMHTYIELLLCAELLLYAKLTWPAARDYIPNLVLTWSTVSTDSAASQLQCVLQYMSQFVCCNVCSHLELK